MVFVYTYGDDHTEYFDPENDQENREMLQHAWPNDFWVNADNKKSLPIYIRHRDGNEVSEPKPTDFSICGHLLQSRSSKKQYMQLAWVQLSQPLDKQSKNNANYKQLISTQVEQLESTKHKLQVDFELARQQHDELKSKQNTEKYRQNKKLQTETNRNYKTLAEQNRRGYSDLFDEESIEATSNQKRDEDWEDDFM